MDAWARSTGAMLLACKLRRDWLSSRLSEARNSRRVAEGASADRGRQTRTMLEARAFKLLFIPSVLSVLTGHVPATERQEQITASRNVSQPVLAVPLLRFVSDCLNA